MPSIYIVIDIIIIFLASSSQALIFYLKSMAGKNFGFIKHLAPGKASHITRGTTAEIIN